MRREVLTYSCVGVAFTILLYVYLVLSWSPTYASSPWPSFETLASHPFFFNSRAAARLTIGALVVLALLCCLLPRNKPLPRALGLCLGVSVCMALLLVVPFTFRRRLLVVVMGYLFAPFASAFLVVPFVFLGYLIALPLRHLFHRAGAQAEPAEPEDGSLGPGNGAA